MPETEFRGIGDGTSTDIVDTVDEENDNARRLNAVHQRRLRASKAQKPSNSFFQLIEATQHVVQ